MKPIKKPFTLSIYSLLLVIVLVFAACKDPITPGPCANGHDWSEWTVTDATETEDGAQTRICQRDNSHTETRVLHATGTAGLAYTLINSNTEYGVESGTIMSGAVAIPAFHRADEDSPYLPVTEIAYSAFMYQSGITSVTIPASVKEIRNLAFSLCSNLATVTFAENSQLESIGDEAFSSSTALKNITIPASVKTIGDGAFMSCSNLATVTFAEGSKLETIGFQAFGSTAIKNIEIPASVKTIGIEAFYGWTASQTITVLGHADKESADKAWYNWRDGCDAIIIYNTP